MDGLPVSHTQKNVDPIQVDIFISRPITLFALQFNIKSRLKLSYTVR